MCNFLWRFDIWLKWLVSVYTYNLIHYLPWNSKRGIKADMQYFTIPKKQSLWIPLKNRNIKVFKIWVYPLKRLKTKIIIRVMIPKATVTPLLSNLKKVQKPKKGVLKISNFLITTSKSIQSWLLKNLGKS